MPSQKTTNIHTHTQRFECKLKNVLIRYDKSVCLARRASVWNHKHTFRCTCKTICPKCICVMKYTMSSRLLNSFFFKFNTVRPECAQNCTQLFKWWMDRASSSSSSLDSFNSFCLVFFQFTVSTCPGASACRPCCRWFVRTAEQYINSLSLAKCVCGGSDGATKHSLASRLAASTARTVRRTRTLSDFPYSAAKWI